MATLSELDGQIQKQVDALLSKEEEASTAAEKLLVLVTDYYIKCEEEKKSFDELVPLLDLSTSQQNRYKRAATVSAKYRLTDSTRARQKSEIVQDISALEQLDRQTTDIKEYEAKRTVKRKLEAAAKKKGNPLDAGDIRKLFTPEVSLAEPRKVSRVTITMASRLKKNRIGYSLLGLSESTPQDVIDIVCRHWSHKYHPDKGGMHEDFIKIQDAIKVINNDK